MSWLLSPSSATKMTPKLRRNACTAVLSARRHHGFGSRDLDRATVVGCQSKVSPTRIAGLGTGAHRPACRSPGFGATPPRCRQRYRTGVAVPASSWQPSSVTEPTPTATDRLLESQRTFYDLRAPDYRSTTH